MLGPAATADPDALVAADNQTVTLTNTSITNGNFTGLASFTSGGPRTGDSWLKPDITAPGVSIISTGNGTGNQGAVNSGTSMASPHVAGVAALVRQAHPSWSVENIKAAIVNTGSPSAIAGTTPYRTSRAGTGLVQPLPAVKTAVVAVGDTGTSTLNFGFEELNADFVKTKQIKVYNLGSSPATFNITRTNAAGSPHSVTVDGSVTIPAGGQRGVNVKLEVPAGTAGASNGSGLSFREVAGLITLTPASASNNNGVTLRVPYYLVPRALSDVNAQMPKDVFASSPTTTVKLSNPSGPIAGDADFYAWGIADAQNQGLGSNDVRAVGTQSFSPAETGLPSQLVVFGVNTWNRWSNAATNEFDIFVDVDPQNANGDDYVVVGADQGAVQTGTFNGRLGSFVFSTRSAGAAIDFLATAPTDSSTALLPVLASRLCRTGEPCLSQATSPRLTYHINSFDIVNGSVDAIASAAKYNAYASSISQGIFASVPRGASGDIPVAITPAEWAQTPALGVMIVSLDNKAGKDEAALLGLTLK